MLKSPASPVQIDCSQLSTREINQALKAYAHGGARAVDLFNLAGEHNLVVGLTQPIQVRLHGPVGYYCGGLCEAVQIEILGSCGWSLGENLMSGQIIVRGNASANAAASARGGKICIFGSAGPRAGISLKGATLIVTGNVGHSSAFMMQQGRMIVCGNAGANLGDSLYDGEIFVGGQIDSLGADAHLDPITPLDWQILNQELSPWGIVPEDYDFKKVVCAQELYHFKARDFAKWKDAS